MISLSKSSFNQLTKTEQVVMVLGKGKDLMIRKTRSFDIHLFKIEELFVEISYVHNSVKIVNVELVDIEFIEKNYANWRNIPEELVNEN